MIPRSIAPLLLAFAAAGCGAASDGEALSEADLLASGGPDPDIVRFLEQSSFGPTLATIAHVQSIGVDAAITEQLAAAPSLYSSGSSMQAQFFSNALNGDDQLRQRVAFALGQIFVVSAVKLKAPNGVWPYLNVLSQDAFGSFEKLLYDVTTSASMGTYLDMVNDDARPGGPSPNENYARELCQLFSIGLWELRDDGALQTDAAGAPIPTYSQDTIESLARVFSGWTYGSASGCPSQPGAHNPPNLLAPLLPCDKNHDSTPAPLFGGLSTAPGWTAAQALASPVDAAAGTSGALASIARHHNVGPFLGKQLIQHLVTSNPSPAYVSRVSAAFADDGSPAHARGNLGAVVRAILTDSEARGPQAPDPSFGHLREPVLYITGLLRLLGAASDGFGLAGYSAQMGQDVYKAPSVFNYYPPTYRLPGDAAGLVAPEMALLNTGTAIARVNFAQRVLNAGLGPGTTIDLAAIPSDPAGLLTFLDRLMLHGTMSADMRGVITQAISAPGLAPLDRVRRGVYLVAASPQYQVER